MMKPYARLCPEVIHTGMFAKIVGPAMHAVLRAICFTGVFICDVQATWADQWDAFEPERAFTYLERPIQPNCVEAFDSRDPGFRIDLSVCTREGDAKSLVTRRHDRNSAWPTFEVEHVLPTEEQIVRSTEFASYQVLARSGPHFAVYVQWNGGGTGIFDGIYFLRRRGHMLYLEDHIAGGDRCVESLHPVSIEDNVLTYDVSLTSPGLIKLGNPTPRDLRIGGPWDCVARQRMTFDLRTRRSTFVSIKLTAVSNDQPRPPRGFLVDSGNWQSDENPQHCFNHIYNSYAERGSKTLKPSELRTFADDFDACCRVHDAHCYE